MKKIITLLFAVLALSAGGLKAEEADAAVAVLSKQYAYKDFQGLSASSTFQVTLVQDSKWYVEVEYSDFLGDYLDVTNRGGILHLGLKPLPRSIQNSRKYKDGHVLRATVHMPVLTRLNLSGVSRLQQEGRFSNPDGEFRMDVSGAAKMDDLAVDARIARIVMSGAAHCNSLEGTFYQIKMNVSGAAKVKVDAAAEDWDVVLSGSANVNLRGPECKTMDIESSGASRADISVASGSLQYEGSGASNLYALDAPARKAKVELSGASNCRIAVKESLDAETSGSSTCRYKAVDGAAIKTNFRGAKIVTL